MTCPQHVSIDSRVDLKREEQRKLERDKAAFLASGGHIRVVAQGISGLSADGESVTKHRSERQHRTRKRAISKINQEAGHGSA